MDMNLTISDDRVSVQTQFSDNISEELKTELKELAYEQADKFSNSYFLKILKKEDAQISISLVMEKTEPEHKFNGKFNVNLDGNSFHWSNDVPFSMPRDIVMHAFKHLKNHLSDLQD